MISIARVVIERLNRSSVTIGVEEILSTSRRSQVVIVTVILGNLIFDSKKLIVIHFICFVLVTFIFQLLDTIAAVPIAVGDS